MKRNEISTILLDELLEEIKERKEINKLKRKQILSIMIDELLEKVEETKDFLLNVFNEVERRRTRNNGVHSGSLLYRKRNRLF